MNLLKRNYILLYTVVLLLSLLGLYNLSLRPSLPGELSVSSEGIDLTLRKNERKNLSLHPSFPDSILTLTFSVIDSFEVSQLYEVEAKIDQKRIGDEVIIRLLTGTEQKLLLISCNDFWYLFLNGILGYSFILISAIIWRKSIHLDNHSNKSSS